MGTPKKYYSPAFYVFTTLAVFSFTLVCACSGITLAGEGDGEDTIQPADAPDGIDGQTDGSGSDVPQDEGEDSPELIVNHTWSIILGMDHEYDWYVEVIQSGDSGYFVAAKLVEPEPEEEEYHLQLLKLDEDGSILWHRQGLSIGAGPVAMCPVAGGGFLVTCQIFGMETFSESLWVSEISENGTVVWQKAYANGVALSIRPTMDGGYVTAGSAIMKIQGNGELQWVRSIENLAAEDALQLSGGGYAVAGSTDFESARGDTAVVKLDENAEIIWQKRLYGLRSDGAHTLVEADDQGVLVGGHITFYDELIDDFQTDLLIAALDGAGSLLWYKTFDFVDRESLLKLRPIPEGGYMGAGYYSDGILVIKFDAAMDQLWAKTYSDPDMRGISSLDLELDGGFVLGTYSLGREAHANGPWILKTDSMGAISETCYIGRDIEPLTESDVGLYTEDLAFVSERVEIDEQATDFTFQDASCEIEKQCSNP